MSAVIFVILQYRHPLKDQNEIKSERSDMLPEVTEEGAQSETQASLCAP